MKNLIILLAFCFTAVTAMADIPIQHSDGRILGIVAVIDENEIHIAQLAESKDTGPRVKDYARMLEAQHAQNLDWLHKISQETGVPVIKDSEAAIRLHEGGEHGLAELSAMNHHDFAREFIHKMIVGHSEVLAWVDNQHANHEKVRKFLHETRQHIAEHLHKAQAIQAEWR